MKPFKYIISDSKTLALYHFATMKDARKKLGDLLKAYSHKDSEAHPEILTVEQYAEMMDEMERINSIVYDEFPSSDSWSELKDDKL